MGLGSSKSQAPPQAPTPEITAEAVEALCREAYAAGAGDADVYNASQREAMQRQDALLGSGACLLSAWLAFVYGRARGTHFAGEVAAHRYNAQQTLLEKVNSDLVAAVEENKGLTTIRQEQEMIIAQQRSELHTAARQRRAMQVSVQQLKRRNATVRRQLRGLTSSLNLIQRQMYVGMIGAGAVLLAVVWGTRPLRRGRPASPPAEPPVAEPPVPLPPVALPPAAKEEVRPAVTEAEEKEEAK